DFYYSHIDFDRESPEAKRLITIFDKLESLLAVGTLPKLRNHEAIHLVLLVDTLWDDYTRSWEGKLSDALGRFAAEMAKAKETRDDAQPNEYWLKYGQWTRTNSDKADTIRRRHQFYVEKMLEFLHPLQ